MKTIEGIHYEFSNKMNEFLENVIEFFNEKNQFLKEKTKQNRRLCCEEKT